MEPEGARRVPRARYGAGGQRRPSVSTRTQATLGAAHPMDEPVHSLRSRRRLAPAGWIAGVLVLEAAPGVCRRGDRVLARRTIGYSSSADLMSSGMKFVRMRIRDGCLAVPWTSTSKPSGPICLPSIVSAGKS